MAKKQKKYRIAAFFSGCGGLDLGFRQAGFEIPYANEYDPVIWDTYRLNHAGTTLDTRSIVDIAPDDIPDVDGFIGGPPCQSWSLAGAMRGLNDHRGQLFYEYLRLLKAKKPLFVLAENVKGMVSSTHRAAFENIKAAFDEAGYAVQAKLLNAKDYGAPQDRERVIVVGFRKDASSSPYTYPTPTHFPNNELGGLLALDGAAPKRYVTLRDAIGDMPPSTPAAGKNDANNGLAIPNHEHMTGGFSTIYMSRNRRRSWEDVSFTIQAGGRHAPLHPSCPPMKKTGPDVQVFTGPAKIYRRMSVRECARVQGFPDNFIFSYRKVADGYKMVGNAVPVALARACAASIMRHLANR